MNDLKYVELHGERIAYREEGRGEAVVLLHGMAGSSESWEAVIAPLGRRYRVIAPDLLGHGQSAKPRTDYSLGAFAAGLRDLCDELGISRATIVGHSLGGGVAMQFLYQHPEYCRRLILVSSGGLGPDVGWILRLLAAPGAELWLPVIAPKAVLAIGNRMRSWLSAAGRGSPRAEQVWAAYSSLSDAPTRAAFLRTLRSVVDYRGQSVSALSRLRLRTEVPTLVIWGDRDPIIPVDHGYGVSAARPGSQLVVLPGLGHFPQVEDPGAVVAAIEEFIAGSADEAPQQAANRQRRPRSVGSSNESPGRDPLQRSVVEPLAARRQIEVGIGVLMGLRGCSQTEAASEFTTAVRETGIHPGDLGSALAGLASGNDDHLAPHRAQALDRWGHLLALRGLKGDPNAAALDHPVRVRYGPENDSVIC